MNPHQPCSDCGHDLSSRSRREFLQTAAVGAATASLAPFGASAIGAEVARPQVASETLVQQLHSLLTPEQIGKCCFAFDDPKRHEIDNNWHITDAVVGEDFTADQQDLIRQIFLGLHSEEYAQQVMNQVEDDGGFDDCSIALFGAPGTGKFQFVLTGRHVTRRCDGDSVAGAAFGGPIFYGHAAGGFNEAPDHPGNAYWFQARRANELFAALDGKQRELALLGDSRGEYGTETVELSGKTEELAGIPVAELSPDQKELAEKVMADLLAPFREADRQECMKLIRESGFDDLHFSYYKNEDVGNDGVWDVWQVEGPSTLWYFRGQPHVHTWVHIRDQA